MDVLLIRACKILDVNVTSEHDISEITLIKQYRKMSLLYHPDKNKSIDAVQKFQEIHDSYEYIGRYLGYIDEEYYIDEDELFTTFDFDSYKDKLTIFLNLSPFDILIKYLYKDYSL